jgi:amino acid transporter
MFWAVAAVALVYIIPISAVGYSGVPASSWSDGAWVSLAGGIRPWLAVPVLLTIMISVIGQVNSLTMSYSRIPLAMAEDKLAPSFLGNLNYSLLFCGLIWTLALSLSLDRILLLDILLYGASLILEFAALVVLRIREPNLVRPFKIPGGTGGAIAISVAPCGLLVLAAALNRHEQVGSISAATLAGGVAICGLIVYSLVKRLCAAEPRPSGSG